MLEGNMKFKWIILLKEKVIKVEFGAYILSEGYGLNNIFLFLGIGDSVWNDREYCFNFLS